MRLPPPVSAAALAAAAALALVACGGDDAGPLSGEELAEEANRICSEQTGRFDEVQVEPPANAHDAVGQTGELISASERALEELEQLDPPEELEDRFDAYLDARRRALELLRQGREAAERQDRKGYSAALDRALAETPKRLQLARRLDMGDCAAPGSPGAGTRSGKARR